MSVSRSSLTCVPSTRATTTVLSPWSCVDTSSHSRFHALSATRGAPISSQPASVSPSLLNSSRDGSRATTDAAMAPSMSLSTEFMTSSPVSCMSRRKTHMACLSQANSTLSWASTVHCEVDVMLGSPCASSVLTSVTTRGDISWCRDRWLGLCVLPRV